MMVPLHGELVKYKAFLGRYGNIQPSEVEEMEVPDLMNITEEIKKMINAERGK